jgi:hypothetical protein
MPLWIIFYLASHISMVIGPVPYDMEECKLAVAEQMMRLNYDVTTDEGYTAKDVKILCEYHAERPRPDGETIHMDLTPRGLK